MWSNEAIHDIRPAADGTERSRRRFGIRHRRRCEVARTPLAFFAEYCQSYLCSGVFNPGDWTFVLSLA